MKSKSLAISMLAAIVLTGCVSKKEFETCQQNLKNCVDENKSVTANYQTSKEQLAAANARIESLEDQLTTQKNNYASLQQSLDRS